MSFINRLQGSLYGEWDQQKPPTRYLSFAHAIDTVNARRIEKRRIGQWPVHVSTAINFCARQQYLIQKLGQEYSRPVSTADVMLWAFGRAVESENRNALIDAYGTQNIYGRWTCLCEFSQLQGLGRDPFRVKCQQCKTSVTHKYHEIPLRYEDLLVGNPDLLILDGVEPKLTVIEFKSIKAQDFDKLTGPTVDYKMQAFFYLKLLELNQERFQEVGITPNLEEFSIIYTSKGYKFSGSVLKEYRIKVSELPRSFVGMFDEIIAELRQTKNASSIPPRTACDSVGCTKAKACPVSGECFSV